MEPLEEAIKVVEIVVSLVCAKLGSEAQEHINPNQLFVQAEFQLKNGLSVCDAVKAIASPLLWEVQEKRERKIINVKKIRDELERSSKHVLVGIIKEELENVSKHLHEGEDVQNNLRLGTLDLSSQGSSSQTSSASNSASGAGEIKPEVGSSETRRPSCIMNEPLIFSLSPGEGSSASSEDNEISVLSPVPPKPAPVIELSDDSSNSSSSSRNSICVVMPEKQNGKIEDEIDIQDAEKVGIPKKLFAALLCKEKALDRNDTVKGLNSHENSDDEIDEKLENKIKPVKEEVTDDEMVHNENDESNNGEQAGYQSDFEDHNPSVKTEDIRLPVSDMSSVFKVNNDTDENRNKKKTINGISSHVTDAVAHQNQASDLLWDDARYVCSLFPYFQLADVYQSMLDNYYHPNRRAYVLEEYLKLAADREENVPDNVSAKKRSYVEDGGAHATAGEKKIKIEHDRTADDKKLWDRVIPNGSLPSTSGANNLVVRDKSNNDLYGAYLTNERTNVNPALELYNSGIREREKWCKEKIEFVSAVICNIDKEVIRVHVESCYTEADVEGLIERLIEEQENSEPVVNQFKENNVDPVSLLRNDQLTSSAFQPVDRGGASAFQPVGQGSVSDASMPGSSAEPQPGTDAEDQAGVAADLEDRIMAQIATLSEMFNDADPDYLQERCVGINGDQAQFQVLVEELLRNKEYPKIEEYNKRQKRLEIKKKFIEGMSVEEFLEYFEDPEKVFCDVEKTMSRTYMENARAQLKRDLPYQFSKDIDNELRKHNYHYLPTLRALRESSELGRRKTKRTSTLKEKDVDDIFIKELCYVRMQTEIKEHLLKKEENKRRAFRWAKAAHQLQECGCCFDDEVLEEDMDTCNVLGSKHKFCLNCIKRFAEGEIGQGRSSFRCLEGECKGEFSLSTLKEVMKPAVFSNLLERKQQEEIAAAGIEDLVACPFCNFQTIMPNKEDKVFKCLNPECMKDSCRFCKEPNHIPLRCEEVEKQHQRDARTFMENRMTEAMVRECWKCKKRFIKEDGCNKMRCSCGAMMCYICKKQIKGYDHFEDKAVPSNPSKCPLWSNSEKIHAEEVRDVAVKLRQEMDPKLDLVHNPLDDLPEVPKHLMNKPGNPAHHQNLENRNPPPAHQNRVQVIPVHNLRLPVPHVHHRQVVRMGGAYLYAFQQGVEAAHHQLPPPAHQQVHPQLPRAMALPEVNGYQHHHYHHHHHHHHHVRQPTRYPELHPPAEPQQMRDDLIDQINEFNEVMQGVRMRDPAAEYRGEAVPWIQQQQAPRNQQQQQQQLQQHPQQEQLLQQQQQQQQQQQGYQNYFMNEVPNLQHDIRQQENEQHQQQQQQQQQQPQQQQQQQPPQQQQQPQQLQEQPPLHLQQAGQHTLLQQPAPQPHDRQQIEIDKFQEYVDML